MTELSIEDFVQACETETVKMSSVLYTNLVRFFLKYEQGNAYHVNGAIADLREVFGGAFDVYERFGIFVGSGNLIWDDTEFNRICIVGSANGVSEAVALFESKLGYDPKFIAILEEVTEDEVNLIQSEYPESMVLNHVEREHTQFVNVLRDETKYRYVDITDVFLDTYNSIVFDMNVKNAKKALDTVRGMEYDANTIFCVSSALSGTQYSVYTAVASILMFDGMQFELNRIENGVVQQYHHDALSRDYMMLNDYLFKLANPVTFGLLSGANAFNLCILNHSGNKEYAPKDFSLHFYSVAADVTENCIQLDKSSLQEKQASYSSLSMLDPIDFFKLNDDFDEAMKKHKMLCLAISDFETVVRERFLLPDNISFDFTNIFFYQNDKSVYMAYLAAIPDVKYSYTFVPLCKSYHAFRNVIGVREYDNIMDIGILSEAPSMIAGMQKYTFPQMTHFKKPRFLDGILLRGISVKDTKVGNECGLSFAEVGVWSVQSSQVRKSAGKFLLERFDSSRLHEKRFLSFWGGCHPMDLIRVTIDNEAWRGMQDE